MAYAFVRACLALLLISVACTKPDPTVVKAESIRRGDELSAKKQYAQAAAAYRVAVEIDPRDGDVRLKLAKAYVSAENWPLAGPEAVRAADLLPDSIDAQLQAAELLLGPGWFPDAAERASKVLRQQPGNVNALMILGNAKAQLRSSALALSKLEEAVRLGADYERVRSELRSNVSSSDDKAAETAFRKAVHLAPENFGTRIALANFLWATGRADESEEELKRVAVASFPYGNRVLGVFYLSRERLTEAEKYLKVAATSGDSDARLALADLYIRTNRDDDALSTLGSMPPAADASGAISLRAASIEFRSNKREEAMRRIDAVLVRLPHQPRAILLKAQFSLAIGDLDQGLRSARAAVAEDPVSSEARSTLGQALSASGDVQNAFNEYLEALRLGPGAAGPPMELARLSLALGRDKEAIEYARQAVRKNPDNQIAALTLVKTLISLHDYATADRELKPLLVRNPASPAVLVQLATLNAARGEAAAARTAFLRALESDRDSFDALSGLVALDLKEGKNTDARQLVERATASHSKDARYLLLAAQVYSADRDASRAESTLRTALGVERGNVRAAISLADLLASQHRREEAKRVLEEFVERQPGSVDAQTSLGMILEDLGDARGAQTRYEKILAQNPRAARASYRLAALYAEQENNLETALSLAVAAKQQLSDDPAVSDLVGWLYTRKNLPTIGLPHLQDAVRAVPDNAIYRYHLGYAHMNIGDLKEAREEFTRALAIDNNFAYADQTRKFLKLY